MDTTSLPQAAQTGSTLISPPPAENGKDKNKLVLAIGGAVVILVIAGIALLTSLRLRQVGTKPIAPTAPESKPQAQTPVTSEKTQKVVLNKFTRGCTEEKGQGKQRGKDEKTANFSISSSCTLNSATIISDKPKKYLYDDFFYILLDDKVFSAENVVLDGSPLTLGGQWDWDSVIGRSYKNHNEKSRLQCLGNGRCEGPATRKSDGSPTTPINMSLSGETLNQLLDQGTNKHSFSAVVTGNLNSNTDCTMTEDLVLNLNLSCTELVPECSDKLDNDGDGKIDCTAGNPDPGCFPDGKGGGGACDSNDDNELDEIETLSGCQATCEGDLDCAENLVCSENEVCINPVCALETDCICNVGGSSLTPPPRVSQPQSSGTLPESGVNLPTVGLVSGGLTSLLLGVLALLL